jgi:hypothetical protein
MLISLALIFLIFKLNMSLNYLWFLILTGMIEIDTINAIRGK